MQNCTNDIDQCVNGKIEIETAWKTEKIFIFKWIGIIERAHGFRHRWAKIENAFGKCAVRAQHLVMCQPATNERFTIARNVWSSMRIRIMHSRTNNERSALMCPKFKVNNKLWVFLVCHSIVFHLYLNYTFFRMYFMEHLPVHFCKLIQA